MHHRQLRHSLYLKGPAATRLNRLAAARGQRRQDLLRELLLGYLADPVPLEPRGGQVVTVAGLTAAQYALLRQLATRQGLSFSALAQQVVSRALTASTSETSVGNESPVTSPCPAAAAVD